MMIGRRFGQLREKKIWSNEEKRVEKLQKYAFSDNYKIGINRSS